MRALAIVAIAAALILSPSTANAGSDSPTPYAVTEAGITLPADTTFPDNGHVNYRTTLRTVNHHFEAKCITRTDAECTGKRHDDALLIGTGFLPIDLEPGECLTWAQISLYDEHFGEGGQEPICRELDPTPDPTDTPTATPEPTADPEPTDPPVITPPITCTPPYAPGWLDESGQPTGCVWNGPDTTEEPSSPTPTPDQSPSPNLPAETPLAPAPAGDDPAPVNPAPSPTSSPSPSSTLPRTSLAETGTRTNVAYAALAAAMIAAGTLTNMLLRRKP